MSTQQSGNTVILTIAGGFYFFGSEISSSEGFIALNNAAMFGGFKGGKGVAGVARGDNQASVILDKFEDGKILHFPLTAVYAILPSIDLYTFKGTTLR